MNASLRIAVLSLSVLGLAACSSMDKKSSSTFVAPDRAPSIMDNDEAYMDAVERIARRRGIDVVWVNAPRRQLVAQNNE